MCLASSVVAFFASVSSDVLSDCVMMGWLCVGSFSDASLTLVVVLL
jgi:hypothetical protein